MAGQNVYENVEMDEAKGAGYARRALPLLSPPPPRRTCLVVSFLALLVLLLAISLLVLVTLNFHYGKKLQELEVIRIYNVSLGSLEESESDFLGLILKGWKFHDGSFYFFSKESKSWEEAMKDCRARGGELASINSGEEKDYLLKKANKMMFWVGNIDLQEHGQQISFSEQEASGDDQPQTEVNKDDCNNIRGDTGRPDKANCIFPSQWICEKRLCEDMSTTPRRILQQDIGWDRFSSKGLQGGLWPGHSLEDITRDGIPQLHYEESESDFQHE